MLTTPQTEPPKAGDWAWLVAIIGGVFSTIVAFIHRMRSKPAPLRIPSQNANEIFERLGYLEKRQSTAEDSLNRAWSAIEEIRVDVRDIKRDMLSRRDLEESSNRLLREVQRMLESRA